MDFWQIDINIAEVYQYDRISQNLWKYVIEKNDTIEVLKQYEYKRKPELVKWDAKGKIIKNA